MLEISYRMTLACPVYVVLSQYYDYEHIATVHPETLGEYRLVDVRDDGCEVLYDHVWPGRAGKRRPVSRVRHRYVEPLTMTFEFLDGRYRGTRVWTRLAPRGSEGTLVEETYAIPGLPNWGWLAWLLKPVVMRKVNRIWREDLDVGVCIDGWPGVPARARAAAPRQELAVAATEVTEGRAWPDVPEGAGRCFRLRGRSVAVFKVHGRLYGVDNRCPHTGGPLALGRVLADGCVECPWHGARFRLATGEHVAGPGEQDIGTVGVDPEGTPVSHATGGPASAASPPPLLAAALGPSVEVAAVSGSEVAVEPGETRRRTAPVVWWFLGGLISAACLGWCLPGELGAFLAGSWDVVLIALLCVLAYRGLDRRPARVGSWVLFGVLVGGAVVFNTLVVWEAVSPPAGAEDSATPVWTTTPGLAAWVAMATVVAGLAGGLSGLAGFRRLGTLLSGTTEWTSVRTLALGAVVSFTVIGCIPLLVLGEPPMLVIIAQIADPSTLFDDGRGVAGQLRDELYALCWISLAAVLAVGFGIRRDWRQTLERLGLRRVTILQCGLAAVLIGVLLALSDGLDQGIVWVWNSRDWPTTDLESIEALFQPFISPWGAVVVGVSAGFGEEVAVRGVLQPRVGILLSNLFFTALHAYQYHWDALLSVFVTGLALGLIRKRWSTSVSALTHGGYDFVLLIWEAGAA